MNAVAFLVGRTVDEIRFGHGVRIVFDPGERVEPAVYVDLGRYTVYEASGALHEQNERDPLRLGWSLAIVGRRVERTSTEAGALELAFSDGSRLRCEPADDYEAWQAVSQDPQHLVVCTPGGDLAVWSS